MVLLLIVQYPSFEQKEHMSYKTGIEHSSRERRMARVHASRVTRHTPGWRTSAQLDEHLRKRTLTLNTAAYSMMEISF